MFGKLKHSIALRKLTKYELSEIVSDEKKESNCC